MSDVFDTCESNFLKSIRFVQKKLTENGDSIIPEMNEAISEATQQLNKMEIECGMCQQSDMKAKISLYKEQLRSYKRKVSQKDRVAKQEKQHLSDQMFEKQQEVGVNPLLQAKRQMYQNQALSNEAMVGIKKNNQKLQKNINRMGDIDSNLTIAQQLLGSIKRKMSKNKYMLFATIFVLVLVVAFVIYTYVK